MAIEIRAFAAADTPQALTLWRSCEGIGLSSADEPQRIAGYLTRNPGMSFTARDGDTLIGAVLCGHDGRRGYLHHLAIEQAYRGQGIGRALVDCCHAALRAQGIDKVHIFVYRENEAALSFWKGANYVPRDTLALLSASLTD